MSELEQQMNTGLQQRKRVLFVDDEPHLLAGLKRALRSQRGDWDVSFAGSGDEALKLVAQIKPDAVISDMRMPGMDGVHLMREISQHYPLTIRIVLSGQSDESSIMGLVGTVHQFLAKPCDVDTLKTVLTRAFTLRSLLSDERIQTLVSSVDSLPSIPAVYNELTRMLESDETSLRDIGNLIATDPPITMKLLQVVNSAFFGIGRHISSPQDAVSILGIDTIKSLVMTAGVFSQFQNSAQQQGLISLDSQWNHCINVGRAARDIAASEGCDTIIVNDSLAAGLLHNIGLLLLAFRMPDTWKQVQILVESENINTRDAIKQVTGTTLNVIGAYLVGLWGLPETVVEAVALSDRPSGSPARAFSALTATHVANAIVHGDDRLDTDYLVALGLLNRLDTWREISDKILMGNEK